MWVKTINLFLTTVVNSFVDVSGVLLLGLIFPRGHDDIG